MSELAFEQAVDELYAWVDAQIAAASPRCEISGRCCRFREYGHRLYISRVEAERLSRATLPAEIDAAEWTRDTLQQGCPYQVQGRCTAREHRPLACRIFFCDPNFEQAGCDLTEQALARLKQICEQFDRAWEYRELADFLVQESSHQLSRNETGPTG